MADLDRPAPRFRTATGEALATLRRHRQEPRDFAVEADGPWLALHEVFEAISHDGGDGGDGAGHAVYFVPEAWTDDLDGIEAALSRLTPAERNDFAIGDDDDREPLLGRDPALHGAHALLNAFFEDWPDVMPAAAAIQRGGWAAAQAEVRALLPRAAGLDTCRGCGCDDLNACVDPVSADPCAWSAPGLCTACVGVVRRVFTDAELTFLLHAAGGGDLNLTRPSATDLTAQGVLALRATLGVIAPKPENTHD